MFDIVIAGGTVIDGTGAPRRRADVGLRGERVVAVAEDLSGAEAGRRIEEILDAVLPSDGSGASQGDEPPRDPDGGT